MPKWPFRPLPIWSGYVQHRVAQHFGFTPNQLAAQVLEHVRKVSG